MKAERGALRVPSAAECLLRVTIVRWALKVAGYDRTRQRIERRIARVAVVGDGDPRVVAAIEYAVAMGAALFPGRAQCLERSLVLYDYLRSRGIAAEMRLGIQRYPFMAHAWVEYRGEPINDVPEHVRIFTAFDAAVRRAGVAP
jgi:Transglutaminase-like superfamily